MKIKIDEGWCVIIVENYLDYAEYIGSVNHLVYPGDYSDIEHYACTFLIHRRDLETGKEPYCSKHRRYAPDGTVNYIKAYLLSVFPVEI